MLTSLPPHRNPFESGLQKVEGKPYAKDEKGRLFFQPTHTINDSMTPEQKAQTHTEYNEYLAAKYAHLSQ